MTPARRDIFFLFGVGGFDLVGNADLVVIGLGKSRDSSSFFFFFFFFLYISYFFGQRALVRTKMTPFQAQLLRAHTAAYSATSK